MTPREQFIAWLNDARSTELAMIPVLKNHANDAKDYPEIYERDMQHLEETQHQAERLEEMITSLGGSVSTVKTMIGKFLGLGQSVSTGIFPDELIKNFLQDYAAEHFEIASYQSLIATAELIGEDQCVPVLEDILREEIAMARWIGEYIPMATAESLKVTAGKASAETFDNSRRYSISSSRYPDSSSRRSNKKSIGARLAKPSVLVTLLSVGAIGAGATLLLRTKNKNGQSRLSQTGKSSFSRNTIGDSLESPKTTAAETLVIEVNQTDDQTKTNPTSLAAGNS